MSWTVFISKTPVKDLSEAKFETLGPKKEVLQKIQQVLPTANFDDPKWGYYRGEVCSIEFNLDDTAYLDYLVLHIRGGGTRPIQIIKALCEMFDCYAMNGDNGEQMDFSEKDEASFKEWQAYRDHVIKNSSSANDPS